MSVSGILSEKGNNVVTINRGSTLQQAADLLSKHRIGAVVVRDETQEVCGILSERDIVKAIAAKKNKALLDPISTCMTSRVISCSSDETVDSLMAKMTKGKFRHLPVIDDGNLVGIISIGDVVKRKIEQAERDTEEMKRYISG